MHCLCFQLVPSADKPEEVQRPPELTTVSMFWNDLPGLMINNKQCVRLVDIHKQMLPAKDTGMYTYTINLYHHI